MCKQPKDELSVSVAKAVTEEGAMDEQTERAFLEFWGRVGSAEKMISDWTGPRSPSFTKEDMDDTWFEGYENIRAALKPLAKQRPFIAPAEAVGDAIFPAETAHEALMFILNPPDTLFGLLHVLTSREYLDIKREARDEFRRARGEESAGVATVDEQPPRPRWDGERRILRYGEKICKKYRQPAPNQIHILEDFEVEGWPPRIDDPLDSGPDNTTRQRTSDAIRALNKKNKFIRFEASGDREGILWEPR